MELDVRSYRAVGWRSDKRVPEELGLGGRRLRFFHIVRPSRRKGRRRMCSVNETVRRIGLAGFRWLAIWVAVAGVASPAMAQGGWDESRRGELQRGELQRGELRRGSAVTPRVDVIDSETCWEFIADAQATTGSSIVRLGDVLRPLQRHGAAWSRLSGTAVGLLPIDGSPAKLSRDRLARLLADAEATPGRIKIHGPDQILVHRVAGRDMAGGPAARSTFSRDNRMASIAASGGPVAVSAGTVASTPSAVAQTLAMVKKPVVGDGAGNRPSDPARAGDRLSSRFGSPASAAGQVIDPQTRERIETWVRLGLDREAPELVESFDIEVHIHPQQLGDLDQIQGLKSLEWLDDLPRWSPTLADRQQASTCQLSVTGRGSGSSCNGIVTLQLQPRAAVVMATRSLSRGHRVRAGDIVWRPAPESGSLPTAELVASPEALVGLETTGLIRHNTPLLRSQFTAPRLVRRGDLLEVQVTGGGVRVTTSAKALADGAGGELIEIETIQPRRRLLARVVSQSLVEVATQPTRLPPER